MHKLPPWFRQDILDVKTKDKLNLLSEFKVNTVCQQAHCPNINTCLKNSELTFMILGDTCTRSCRFCAVNKISTNNLNVDLSEPYCVSEMVRLLGLKYVIITSVTRDDLVDGGASQFVKTISAIHEIDKNIGVEVLIPDFKGNATSIKSVVDAKAVVIGHNLEIVESLYRELKPESSYRVSLDVLRKIKEVGPWMITKSSLMLGLGESKSGVLAALEDLRSVACDILTLGQYLAPSAKHYPVKEFISPEQFDEYKGIALSMGFKAIFSAPLARSSYQAQDLYQEVSYA